MNAMGPTQAVTPELRRLLDAIRQVESGGRAAPPDGDGGKSIGPYQIQERYWRDAMTPGRYEQCRGRVYSEQVMIDYWRRYAPASLRYASTPGVYGSIKLNACQALSRIHNGGPRGWASPATVKYWERVLNEMNHEGTKTRRAR